MEQRMTAGKVDALDTDSRPAASPLGQLNARFHERIEATRQTALDRIQAGEVPVLLRLDDRLIIAHGSRVSIAAINGAEYHLLKALAHLPVTAHLEANQATESSAGEFAEAVDTYERFLTDRSIDARAYRRLIMQLVDGSLGRNQYNEVSAVQHALIALAAADEVAKLAEVTARVEQELASVGCWERTHGVICGGNQPRYKHLSKHFFKRLLTEQTGSGDAATHRIVYSETCDHLEKAKELVADRLVNAKLAELFMDSPISLDADVLGDAGLAAIERVFADSDLVSTC